MKVVTGAFILRLRVFFHLFDFFLFLLCQNDIYVNPHFLGKIKNCNPTVEINVLFNPRVIIIF